MLTVKSIAEMKATRAGLTGSVGFVPTMGALHEGHLSLIRRSKDENDATVVSIYVNPTQFGPREDLSAYPRPIDDDLAKCGDLGVDVAFVPASDEVYPPDFATWVEVEGITNRLCGLSRPEHFRGVTTVVLKLLNIVAPTRAYFGRKDAQQLIVIRRMVEDLNVDCEVVTCATMREPDGLAMSSRHAYLDESGRKRAASIYPALMTVQRAFDGGERGVNRLVSLLEAELGDEVDRVDYAEIVRERDLGEIETISEPALCAVAVHIGTTRLIDNITLTPDEAE